jgi:hypothetical protein
MSDPHVTPEGAAHHPPATAGAPFSEEELHEFHRSDVGAGGVIVALMTGIFVTGLVLYIIVALAAWALT